MCVPCTVGSVYLYTNDYVYSVDQMGWSQVELVADYLANKYPQVMFI